MLLIVIIEISYAFGILFTLTELFQRIILAFDENNDMINQFEWYLFPIEIQRLLPMTMMFAQKSIQVKSFGSKACDRETFKSVSDSGCVAGGVTTLSNVLKIG